MRKLFAFILCSVCCNLVAAQSYTLEQLKDSALHILSPLRQRGGIKAGIENLFIFGKLPEIPNSKNSDFLVTR